MPRRASLFVFLGFAVALVFVTGISAGARSGEIRAKKADVAAAQDRLMEIRMEVSAAQASYNNALYEMNQLNGQIAGAKEDLDGARKRFKAAKKSLEERAALVYKSQNVAFMDVLVGVDDFSEFASRLDLWIRLLGRERADFVKVWEAKEDLLARKARLEAEREQRYEAVERAMDQRKRAKKAEARAEAYLDSLNADLRAAIEAAQDRRAEQAQATAAAIIEPTPEPGKKESRPAPKPVPVAVPESQPEPVPEVEASQVKQVPVPKPDLGSEQAAADREAAAKAAAAEARRLAEQRAAERKAAREAEQQAAAEQRAAARVARVAEQRAARQEAREEAQRQAERAAERAAARRAAREEAERRAELAAERAAIEEAAAEQAAAERAAARRAAERRAERLAAREAEQAAEASASASAAAEKAAERAQARREARAEVSASASSSASASAQASRNSGGGSRNDASASSSASASASAAPGGGGASAMGGDVISVAMEHLGTPYVLSTPGPCKAFVAEDCSCFTMLVYQEFGIALPDSPGGQMGYGTPVIGAPQAGDLLFWSEDGSGYITHVGIAMGDGTTIHASNAAGEVSITSINYINGYVGARRLL